MTTGENPDSPVGTKEIQRFFVPISMPQVKEDTLILGSANTRKVNVAHLLYLLINKQIFGIASECDSQIHFCDAHLRPDKKLKLSK